jgi:hypothetical protein
MHFAVSGRDVFNRKGCPDEVLKPEQTVFNSSKQLHVMETCDEPA